MYQFNHDSVQFSHSVMSDSLRPYEPQHASPPCPSPTPRVYPNSCTLSRWCHPAISSCCPLFLPPSIFLSIRVCSSESALRIRWPKWLRDHLPLFPGFGQSRQGQAQWLLCCMSGMVSLREVRSCLTFQTSNIRSGGKGRAKHRRANCRDSWCRDTSLWLRFLGGWGGAGGPPSAVTDAQLLLTALLQSWGLPTHWLCPSWISRGSDEAWGQTGRWI